MKPGTSSGRSNRKERSFALTPAPNGSLVKVESIFVDIVANEQIKPKECEHFTIRGFVSDSRKHNEKLCLPLYVDAGTAGSKEIDSSLYPLHAPHFKSWQCDTCLNDINTAAGKKGSHNISVHSSKQLKEKCVRSQRSLENVLAYLSQKLKQSSKLGRSHSLCQGVNSTSRFKQKQKHKQTTYSVIHSTTRKLEKNELRDAATGFILNRQDSLTCVDEHQNKPLRPPRTTTSSKFTIVDGSQHKSSNGAATKLVQLQHDDSVGTGCRKIKAKKVRLLNEILDKDGKNALPAMAKCFHADEHAKASCSALQGLQKIQLDNVKFHGGQKRNNNGHEQERNWSQMHHANTLDGNCDKRKAQGLNSAIANELHVAFNDGCSDRITEQSDKMLFGGKQRSNGHKNYPHCHNKLFSGQAFHGRVAKSSENGSMPYSQFKGKSSNIMHKVHAGANLLSSTDYGRRQEENNVTQKNLEKIHIGQTQYFQPTQEGNSIRQHYSFAEGCLDPRNGTGGWFHGVQNGNLSNDTRMCLGESSSAYKYLVDKSIHHETNSISALKRSNPGPCGDNKKSKHSRRSEGGPTVVHRTEQLLRNSNKKMRGNPESTLGKIRGSQIQEVGTSDDIPMEIVELMAKNQYERHLHEVGDDHHKQQSSSYRKKDLVARPGMLPSDVSQRPLHEKPHIPIAPITFEENLGISNGKPKDNILQRPNGSTHRPLIPSQRELSGIQKFPAIGSSKANIFQIQNSEYDMNKLASEQRIPFRSQGQFELWQPTQRSGRTDCPWPPQPNNPVHKFSVPQGSAVQSINFGEVPKCSIYAGEDRAFSNIALAGEKTNIIRPEASHSQRPTRVNSRPQMTGSPDPYANEAISAMNLLSLMNGRPQSSTEINMDAVADRKTFDRSFSNDHLARELSGNSFAEGKLGQKLKQPSPFSYQSKNPQSDASCRCSPPVPTFCSAPASRPGDVVDKRGVQPPSYHQERVFSKVNPGGSRLPNENRSIIYQQSPFTVAFQQLIPARELANHVFSTSWPVPGSNHLHINGNFNGYNNLVANESYETLAKFADLGVCHLNQNPMEFSTPGPGNEFMIGPGELRLRKAYPPKFTRPMAPSSFKQQGFVKYAAPNNRL